MGDAIEVLKALVKEKPDTEINTESASPYEVLYDDLVRHVLYGISLLHAKSTKYTILIIIHFL